MRCIQYTAVSLPDLSAVRLPVCRVEAQLCSPIIRVIFFNLSRIGAALTNVATLMAEVTLRITSGLCNQLPVLPPISVSLRASGFRELQLTVPFDPERLLTTGKYEVFGHRLSVHDALTACAQPCRPVGPGPARSASPSAAQMGRTLGTICQGPAYK